MKKLASFVLITSLFSSILAGCSDGQATSANGRRR